MRDGDPPPAHTPTKRNQDNALDRSLTTTPPQLALDSEEPVSATERPHGSPPVAVVPSCAPPAAITIIPARDAASPASAASAHDAPSGPALGQHTDASSSRSDGAGSLLGRGLEGLGGGAALNLVPSQRQELLSPLECNMPSAGARPQCVIDCRFCRYVCEGRISPSSGGISPMRSPNRRSPTLISSPRGSPGSE